MPHGQFATAIRYARPSHADLLAQHAAALAQT